MSLSQDENIQLFDPGQEITTDLTSPAQRAELARTLDALDISNLTPTQMAKYLASVRVAMAAFITKVNDLESFIVELKEDQLTTRGLLCAQAENIEALRKSFTSREEQMLAQQVQLEKRVHELEGIKTTMRNARQHSAAILATHFTTTTKKFLGEEFYSKVSDQASDSFGEAVRDLLASTMNPSSLFSSEELEAYTQRLCFALFNGFKWNANNRTPIKLSTQMSLLEKWEAEFGVGVGAVELELASVLNKKKIASAGAGCTAAALLALEREMGALLPERKTLSVFNCYQKAAKAYKTKRPMVDAPTAQTPISFDAKRVVRACFSGLPEETLIGLENRLKRRVLGTKEQVVSAIKKLASRSVLPTLPYEPGNSEIKNLYALQSGKHDSDLAKLVS